MKVSHKAAACLILAFFFALAPALHTAAQEAAESEKTDSLRKPIVRGNSK